MPYSIIVDVDDVILDWTKSFSEFAGFNFANSPKRIHECLGITFSEEKEIIHTFNISPAFSELPLVDGALSGIHFLMQHYDVSFVTSCGTHETIQRLRRKQLTELFGSGIKVEFLPMHTVKLEPVTRLRPKIIIDDNYDNVMCGRNNGAIGYLFTTPWSVTKGPTHNWEQILSELAPTQKS